MNMATMVQFRNSTLLLLVFIMAFAVSPILGESPSCVFQRQACIVSCTGTAKFKCEENSSPTTQAKASACVCTDELNDSLNTLVEATTCLLLEKRCKLSCPSGSTPDFQCSTNGRNVSQACACTDTGTDEREERLVAGEQNVEEGEGDGAQTRRPSIIGGLIQDDGTQSLFATGDSGAINTELSTSDGEMIIYTQLYGALLLAAMLLLP